MATDDPRNAQAASGVPDRAAEAPRAAVVAAGVVAFLTVWGTLFLLQRHTLHPLRDTTPRFPTPPDAP